jgi:hypothetical protein
MNSPRGFIALTSVIIISAILLIVTVGASLMGFYSRYNVMDVELKEHSLALGDACVEVVRLRLAGDSLYAGPETVAVGSDQCQIFTSPNPTGNPRVFITQAVYHRSYTNLKIAVDVNDLSVDSWQETPTYP